ncbi:MAG: FMN-binding negative transcriptional regulator [Rhodospirillales bacterium]|jgi:transcriptional regulator|nr:FMN-binding negative transcriptional regulator [Rhodospirillaceae bacterium]MBT5034113.1 FMN-binding negative transcriptional regulator [Rhodospirillaceae bacterium]MBT8003214.1 FMN-binding negative transcriptional regulator [Rhodospirillales bacterium]
MYTPPAYRQEDPAVLHDLIDEFGFATLVTLGPEGPTANHIPMLIDRGEGPYGRLRGHLSKGNPQFLEMRSEVPALAIFQGPHTYVSPNWYPSKQEHGKVVPTWNYVAVHATGPLTVIEDDEGLMRIIDDLTRKHEQNFENPWNISDAPDDYIQRMLKGIIGFEIQIGKLEGKWKMSQNKPKIEDRRGVIEGLNASGNLADGEVAAIMSKILED